MRSIFIPVIIPVTAAIALAGCDTVREYTPDIRLGVLETSEENEPAPQVDTTPRTKTMVARAERIEIGQTSDGVAVAAFGEAPATGWFAPELRPRNGGLPSIDGLLEFDFVAAPPELNGGVSGAPGTAGQRRIRADYLAGPTAFLGVAGVRVHALNGPIEMRF